MKKPAKKLRLSRETVRDLDRSSLTHIAGGDLTTAANCTLAALGCRYIPPPTKTNH